VRQSGALAARPLHHPNRQRLRSRVMGFDDRAKPLSGDGGRRGAALRKKNQAGMVRRWRRSPRSSKWRSKRRSRSGDDGSDNADEDIGKDGIGEGVAAEERSGVRLGLTLTTPITRSLFIPLAKTLCPPWALPATWAAGWTAPLECGLGRAPLWTEPNW
jgi:hypothetical protein